LTSGVWWVSKERRIDFVYHSTLGLRVIKKKKKKRCRVDQRRVVCERGQAHRLRVIKKKKRCGVDQRRVVGERGEEPVDEAGWGGWWCTNKTVKAGNKTVKTINKTVKAGLRQSRPV